MPAVTDTVAARPGSVDEQRREAKDPPVDADVVDLDTASAKSSSTSRYDRPNLRYQRTANMITSGGNRNPANAEGTTTGGRQRRRFMLDSVAARLGGLNATAPSGLPSDDMANRFQGTFPHDQCARVALDCRPVLGDQNRGPVTGGLVGTGPERADAQDPGVSHPGPGAVDFYVVTGKDSRGRRGVGDAADADPGSSSTTATSPVACCGLACPGWMQCVTVPRACPA